MSGTGARRRRRSSAGFTLLEVLVSALILAFGLTALLRVFAHATASLDAASETITSAVFLGDRLEQAREPLLTDGALSYGSSAGAFEDHAGRSFVWRLDVTRSGEVPGLSRVSASLQRAPSGRRQSAAAFVREPVREGT